MHGWDAEDTIGRAGALQPAELAADGVGEFLAVEVPTNGRLAARRRSPSGSRRPTCPAAAGGSCSARRRPAGGGTGGRQRRARRFGERPDPRAVRSASGGQPRGHRRPGGGPAVPGLVRHRVRMEGASVPTRRLTVTGAAALRRGAGRAGGAGGVPGRRAGRGRAGRGRAGAAGRTTRPTCRWSRSTRRAAATSTRRCTWPPGPAAGSGSATRSPTWPRSSGRAARSTPRPGGAPRPSTAPTCAPRCTRRCSARARPACCRTRSARPCSGGSTSTAAGEVAAVDVRRALVRSRAQLDYPGLQAALDAGTAPEPVALLPRVGELRTALARARHATELDVPEQEVVPAGRRRLDGASSAASCRSSGGTRRSRCSPAPARPGSCSTAGIGLLRTLPAPRPEDVAALRRLAPALGDRLAGRGRAGGRDLRARRGDARAGGVPRARGGAAARGRVHAGGRGAAGRPAAPRRRPAVRARHRADPAAGRPVRQRGLRRARRRGGGAGLGPRGAARAAGADDRGRPARRRAGAGRGRRHRGLAADRPGGPGLPGRGAGRRQGQGHGRARRAGRAGHLHRRGPAGGGADRGPARGGRPGPESGALRPRTGRAASPYSVA